MRSPLRFLDFAFFSLVFAACASCPHAAHAQSLRISADLDYAAELNEADIGTGGGAGLRAGTQLDLVAATLILEAGGSYHRFSGLGDPDVWRGIVGGEVRIGKIIEPGLFAHVGVGRLSGPDAFTAPTVDIGLALDLTLIPLIDVGAHVAYDALLGTDDRDGFGWITAGLHAALVI